MVDQTDFFTEMEERLFGSKVRTKDQLYISDKDFVPLKTGIEDYKIMKYGPKHILDADDYEPLYIHQENILEDCLNREAERVAFQHNLMNRVVFDSVNEAKQTVPKMATAEENKEATAPADVKPGEAVPVIDQTNPLNLPTI